jgi:hypothetical protein
MRFRTILKTADTGGLDRALVRQAVIRVRDRREAAAAAARWGSYRPGTGVLIARECPIEPYGVARPDPRDPGEDR